MPPSASIPLAILFYLLFLWLVPARMNDAFFAGFLVGYLVYDMVHYAIHHANFKSSIMKNIKQHHMLHHYSDSTKGYGVSSSLWDVFFSSQVLKIKSNRPLMPPRLFTTRLILTMAAISAAYMLVSYLLIGFRPEQLFLVILCNLLFFCICRHQAFCDCFLGLHCLLDHF